MTPSAKSVRFDEASMWVEFVVGRALAVPFARFPRLLRATPEQRERVEIGPMGMHWEGIDEDISFEGLLAGRGDRTKWGRRERRRAADNSVRGARAPAK